MAKETYQRHMEKDTKNNLKDSGSPLGVVLKDSHTPIYYVKTNKLITALYMVTDIMDKDEPLRNKLRTLGTGIISDMHHAPVKILPKISEIMSFLDIAGAVNLISDMNAGILRKEFFELKKLVKEFTLANKPVSSDLSLSELFNENFSLPSSQFYSEPTYTRLGVQKGSTLLKAIKDMSDTRPNDRSFGRGNSMSDRNKPNIQFEILKGQRREDIEKIIKESGNGATITDIRNRATGALAACGEKTLQRELRGMLKDALLKKTGKKRWSRYFLA